MPQRTPGMRRGAAIAVISRCSGWSWRAIPGPRPGAAGIVIAPQRVSRFAFQRFLDDQPPRQSDELRTPILHLAAACHQRPQLLAFRSDAAILSMGCSSRRLVAKPPREAVDAEHQTTQPRRSGLGTSIDPTAHSPLSAKCTML